MKSTECKEQRPKKPSHHLQKKQLFRIKSAKLDELGFYVLGGGVLEIHKGWHIGGLCEFLKNDIFTYLK